MSRIACSVIGILMLAFIPEVLLARSRVTVAGQPIDTFGALEMFIT